jgi:biopolymer transport protein ExbB
MYTALVSFFQSGGSFMYPILLVLAIGVAIAVERYLFLSVTQRNNRKVLSECMPLLQGGDLQQVYTLTSKSKTTIGQILSQGLARLKTAKSRDDIEAAMEESMMEALPRLEKRTHYLAMFANIATLLGLLGTIIGLIKAFTAVAQVDPSMKAEILSSSISVAMNTTAFGLIVAIPLIFIYTVLQTKTTEIVDSFEMATIKSINIIMQHKDLSK